MNPVIAMPGWWGATIAAFQISNELGVSMLVGQFGQWFLKSTTRVPNEVAIIIILAAGVGGYAFLHHPVLTWEWEVWRQWLGPAIMWAGSALGFGSAAGHTGGAPGTNSRGPGSSITPEVPMKPALLLAVALSLALVPAAYAAPTEAVEPVWQSAFTQVAPAPPDETTNPWYSVDNLTIAVGANYGWWNGGDAVVISPRKEFVFGLYNAWTLTEHFDAIGNVEYGVDSKIRGFKLGFRYIAKGPK